tara:strand:- start:63 stop:509 length:447 start_codon:yes stop_codon:yes gene_type:complete
MKKYIVIDTWNGEGYSYNNGVDTKKFQYKKSAMKHAYKCVLRQTEDAHDVQEYEKEYLDDGYYWETYNDDAGSYQVHEIKDAYAVMIQCNTNEVYMLNEKEFNDKISELDEEYGEDLEDYSDTDDNGDKYYCSLVDDYDYQFRLIKNL